MNSRQAPRHRFRFCQIAGSAIGRRLVSVPFLLFAGFFLFYFSAAEILDQTPVYERLDVFFESDTRRVWRDMVGERLGKHSHSSGHPNFVILHQPVGWTLAAKLKKHMRGVSKMEAGKMASKFMTSAAASGVVVVFYFLLLAHQIPRQRAILFSCVLGFSTVQMVFSGIPETYIFSALGLTAAALVASRRDMSEVRWQVSAVYAWSALTTNIVQLCIWAVTRHSHLPWRACIKRVIVATGITTALMVLLNLAQAAIYPNCDLFFIPHSIARESSWLTWERFESPLEHARILFQHQWLSNIVAPEPVRIMNAFRPTWPTASIEAGNWEMLAPAWPLFALWCVLLAGLVAALFLRRFYTPAVIAALAVMAFHFCFFFVFGHDRMLYAALWTSTSVFLVAVAWESLVKIRPALTKSLTALLCLFVTCEAWHNWHFLGKIAALVK